MRFPLPMPCWCYERIMWRRRARHGKIGVQGFAAQRAASTTPADSESGDAESMDPPDMLRLDALDEEFGEDADAVLHARRRRIGERLLMLAIVAYGGGTSRRKSSSAAFMAAMVCTA